jgi:hypothetical protein
MSERKRTVANSTLPSVAAQRKPYAVSALLNGTNYLIKIKMTSNPR